MNTRAPSLQRASCEFVPRTARRSHPFLLLRFPIRTFIATFLCLTIQPAFAAPVPNYTLSNPVLRIPHTRAQIAFERAPAWIVHACNDPPFHEMWIYAQTSRPEGTYILTYGSIWVSQDVPSGQPPLITLEDDGNGGIDLLKNKRACIPMWDADNAFNNFFPNQPGNLPTPAQTQIVRSLASDLIAREEQIFGGAAGFLQALNETGDNVKDEYPVLVPFLEKLRSDQKN